MMQKLWAIFLRDLQMVASYRAAFLFEFTAPLFMIISFYFIGRLMNTATIPGLDRYGGDYFAFALVGIVFSSYVGIALGTVVSAVRTGQASGTLEVILTTQTSLVTFLAGSSLYGLLRSSILVVLYLAAGGLFLKVSFAGANVMGGVLALLLSMLSLVGLGIFSAAFILMFKRGDPITLVLSSSAFLLSGVAYPIAVLPGWMQVGSTLLPHTYALEALRMTLLQGASLAQVAPELGALVLFAAVLLPIGLMFFRYTIHRARVEGSFGQF